MAHKNIHTQICVFPVTHAHIEYYAKTEIKNEYNNIFKQTITQTHSPHQPIHPCI